MHPYDLPGPEFLGLYLGLLIAVAASAGVLHWWLRKPGPAIDQEDPPLTPYETAYLAGGKQAAVHAAVVGLARKDAVSVTGAGRLSASESISGITHPLEWAVYEEVNQSQDVRLSKLSASEPLVRIRESLEERGLLVAAARRTWVRLVPTLVCLSLVLFGLGKIVVGIDRQRPVAFLIVLVAFTALWALGMCLLPVERSRRGDDLLRRLRTRNAALKTTLQTAPTAAGGDDTALAVALFGTAILVGGPLNDLARATRPHPAAGAGGDGGGCGAGHGCGGGGGGGGGGCGGGGCGGCGGG
jgi:uncharacterized protein (TIGR04222 family)